MAGEFEGMSFWVRSPGDMSHDWRMLGKDPEAVEDDEIFYLSDKEGTIFAEVGEMLEASSWVLEFCHRFGYVSQVVIYTDGELVL